MASVQQTSINSVALLCSHTRDPIPSYDNVDFAPTTLAAAKSHLDPADRWSVKHLTAPDDGAQIATLLASAAAIAVSDGSYDPDTQASSSAFILTTRAEDHAILPNPVRGCNRVPGKNTDQNSYRGELVGMMGVVVTLGLICQVHHVQTGSIEIGLDANRHLSKFWIRRIHLPRSHPTTWFYPSDAS